MRIVMISFFAVSGILAAGIAPLVGCGDSESSDSDSDDDSNGDGDADGDGDECSGPIEFKDESLEAGVREAIGKPDGEIIFDDVADLDELDVSGMGIAKLGGIECLTGLVELRLASNELSDIEDLSALTDLEVLYLSLNQLTDLEPVKDLKALKTLVASENQVEELGPLSGLADLEALYLQQNLITDLSPLVDNGDIGEGDMVNVMYNPLECEDQQGNIDELVSRGVDLRHECAE